MTSRHVLSIATLLSECGVLPLQDLGSITATAVHEGLTIGQYLQKNNLVHPQVVRGAILCHLLLHRKLVSFVMAVEALKMTAQHKCKIELALSALNWNRAAFENNLQASKLLQRSGAVSNSIMGAAYEICMRDGQPLLTVLLKRGSITDVIAESVLTLQGEIEQGKSTLDEAVAKLRHGESSDSSDNSDGSSPPRVLRLGEILLAADLINSVDLISAIEIGRAEQLKLGQILVRDFGFSQDLIKTALYTQSQINNQFTTISDGILSLTAQKLKQAN